MNESECECEEVRLEEIAVAVVPLRRRKVCDDRLKITLWVYTNLCLGMKMYCLRCDGEFSRAEARG